jgi:hypothetical protein
LKDVKEFDNPLFFCFILIMKVAGGSTGGSIEERERERERPRNNDIVNKL